MLVCGSNFFISSNPFSTILGIFLHNQISYANVAHFWTALAQCTLDTYYAITSNARYGRTFFKRACIKCAYRLPTDTNYFSVKVFRIIG